MMYIKGLRMFLRGVKEASEYVVSLIDYLDYPVNGLVPAGITLATIVLLSSITHRLFFSNDR
ncbi:hypothetical protein AGMMS49573_10440 [Endomicrobiia bacterium]|nr:hypothetical protein AGMMS49573_10440 [Endomicrobiia bacterium]